METSLINKATCDLCAKVFKETKKRFYCERCDVFFYVCKACKNELPKCTHCGIPLRKKTEPLIVRQQLYMNLRT